MSIRSRMGKGFVLFTFVTTQTLGVSQAQVADPQISNAGAGGTGAGQVVGAIGGIAANFATSLPRNIYNSNPAQLMLQQQQAMLQQQLSQCQLLGGATSLVGANGLATAGTAAVNASTKVWADMQAAAKAKAQKGKVKTTANATAACDMTKSDESICSMKCPDPTFSPTVSCSKYFNDEGDEKTSETRTRRIFSWRNKTAKADLENINTEFNRAATFYKNKAEKCGPSGNSDFENTAKVLSCMQEAMKVATSQAALAVQKTLSENQTRYETMNQYQGEVAEQIAQVEAILGPDEKFGGASGEFKGLIGLQNELQEQLKNAKEGEANFEDNLAKIDQDEKTNEQTLEAERVGVVVACLKGDPTAASGGRAQTCPKPQMIKGQDGKEDFARLPNGNIRYVNSTCGTFDYVRARISQQAMIDNGRYMDRDAGRRALSENAAATYDGTIEAIMRGLGSFQKPTQSGALQGSMSSWADIEKNSEIMGRLRDLDSDPKLKGVNVVATLKRATLKCTSDSKDWKTNQLNSGGSDYNTRKQTIVASRKKLNAALDNGLADLNRSYKNIMSVLSDLPVNSPRFNCAQDSTKMMDCYKNIRQNVSDLLEGVGRSGFSSKLIKGGDKVAGFNVPCRGINGCVTALKTVRDRQKEHVNLAQKMKMKFVTEGNQQVQTQLQSFAQVLSVGNAAIGEQFQKFKNAMIAMGVSDIPDSLKPMTPEALKASQNGEGKEPGPYQNPENMAAVLSGMAGGIADPTDSGLGKAIATGMASIKEKKEAWAKKAEEFATAAREYSEAESTCVTGALLPGGRADDDRNVGVNLDCNKEVGTFASKYIEAYPASDLLKNASDFIGILAGVNTGDTKAFNQLKGSLTKEVDQNSLKALAVNCSDGKSLESLKENLSGGTALEGK